MYFGKIVEISLFFSETHRTIVVTQNACIWVSEFPVLESKIYNLRSMNVIVRKERWISNLYRTATKVKFSASAIRTVYSYISPTISFNLPR